METESIQTDKSGFRSIPSSGAVIASAPGRVCLAGENLDWMVCGPSVVATIPLRTRAMTWHVEGLPTLVLSSGAPLDSIKLVPPANLGRYEGHPLRYMQAAVRVAIKDPSKLVGLVVSVSTDLPVQAGLGSSAAVTLAVAAATSGLTGYGVGDVGEICKLAYEAESIELQTGAGWMDFLACAHGGVNEIVASGNATVRPIAPYLAMPTVLVDTFSRRESSVVLALEGERLRRREPGVMAYVRDMMPIVEKLTAALRQSDVDWISVGKLVSAAHTQLRDRLDRSSALIEQCVNTILDAGGLGAKLCGTGGCVVGLVPPEAMDDVLRALTSLPVRVLPLPAIGARGVEWSPH